MSLRTEFAERLAEYEARMGAAQSVKRLEDDPNTRWLESQLGQQLDALPLAKLLELLEGKPNSQAMARRLGRQVAQSPMYRPDLLLALFRQSEALRQRQESRS